MRRFKLSLQRTIVDKAFGGRSDFLNRAQKYDTTGTPTGITAGVGDLVYNTVDDDVYITTVDSTTWVKINA